MYYNAGYVQSQQNLTVPQQGSNVAYPPGYGPVIQQAPPSYNQALDMQHYIAAGGQRPAAQTPPATTTQNDSNRQSSIYEELTTDPIPK